MYVQQFSPKHYYEIAFNVLVPACDALGCYLMVLFSFFLLSVFVDRIDEVDEITVDFITVFSDCFACLDMVEDPVVCFPLYYLVTNILIMSRTLAQVR